MDLTSLSEQFQKEVGEVRSEEELLKVKSSYLGKKGHLSTFLRGLGTLPLELRPVMGSRANELKTSIEEECRQCLERLTQQKKQKQLQLDAVDGTLPGRWREKGFEHPITQVMEEVEDIFRELGFAIFEGPEIETDFFNFEALNIPADHPARDMQDTFYLEAPSFLLRTHTSPVQIHVMKKTKPPIRMIAPGAVYRRDSDVSHTPMFHQVEGLVVDHNIQFSHLKGIVEHFLKRFFGSSKAVRFRPSYFPFTEPSAEVDIECVNSDKTCPLCKGTGWLEVMGCGMVHPNVFRQVGYASSQKLKALRGFAFGMGIERLTMLKFGIPDIRLFFENDLRFLKQF